MIYKNDSNGNSLTFFDVKVYSFFHTLFTNNEQNIYRSNKQIAGIVGCCVRTVQRAIYKLKNLNFITKDIKYNCRCISVHSSDLLVRGVTRIKNKHYGGVTLNENSTKKNKKVTESVGKLCKSGVDEAINNNIYIYNCDVERSESKVFSEQTLDTDICEILDDKICNNLFINKFSGTDLCISDLLNDCCAYFDKKQRKVTRNMFYNWICNEKPSQYRKNSRVNEDFSQNMMDTITNEEKSLLEEIIHVMRYPKMLGAFFKNENKLNKAKSVYEKIYKTDCTIML